MYMLPFQNPSGPPGASDCLFLPILSLGQLISSPAYAAHAARAWVSLW